MSNPPKPPRQTHAIVPPPALEWRGVSLDLGEFALRNASLRLERGSWMCILGPTGAGKTLLLDVAAGFRAPSAGTIWRDGLDATAWPPEDRRIAYVPQDDLLFPHLDVKGNLWYAVPRRHRNQRDWKNRATRIIGGLGIGHLLDRRVTAISGGEAQRVAIGRALLRSADVLLLDESTSALDEDTRGSIGKFLADEQGEGRLSIVQVTHDRAEAERLADVVVSIESGYVVDPGSAAPPSQGNVRAPEASSLGR